MVRVRLDWASCEVALIAGERLLDAIDELPEPPLAFPCRDASCGECAVHVARGADLFQPAAQAELDVLAADGAAPATRLACQLRAGAHSGEVVLTRHRASTAPS